MLVEKYPRLLLCELPQNHFVKTWIRSSWFVLQTEIIGVISRITCSNNFSLSQFFAVFLEIYYIIFYPNQSGSMSFTVNSYPSSHLSFSGDWIPPYSFHKDWDIRDAESRRIQMLISVVYNIRRVRDRSPSHDSLTTKVWLSWILTARPLFSD